MKIIFFGLGSIGNKQCRILLRKNRHELYAFRSKKNSINVVNVTNIYNWKEFNKIKPQVAFITNPTFKHIDTAIKCALADCNLFIEKPLGDNLNKLDKLTEIIKEKHLVAYVAYHLRFHPIIQRLKEYLAKHKFLHMRLVCSSYLPNWRPTINYRKSYSANKNMGGGVILDLSHEIDFTDYLLGGIKKMTGQFSRRSNLTIDCEDFADILVEAQKGPANIHVNFFSHYKQRSIQLDFDNLTVIGDLINNSIKEYQQEKLTKTIKVAYSDLTAYKNQIDYFFQNINNPLLMNNIFEAAILFRQIINFKKTHGKLKP